jgi:hypothetical protein
MQDFADIHIAPQGFEVERIYKPANERKIREAYLLYPKSIDNEQQEKCIERVRGGLNETIDVTEKDCDIFDFEDSLEGILEVIGENEGKRIEVNLATGSKITAIAGLLACMKTEAEPIYVRGENYGDTVCEAESSEPVSIPSLELSRPSGDKLILLRYIYENEEPTVNELRNELDDKLDNVAHSSVQTTLKEPATQEYVNIIPNRGVKLTDKGEKLMQTLDLLGEL